MVLAVACLAMAGCDTGNETENGNAARVRALEREKANLAEENRALLEQLEAAKQQADPATIRNLKDEVQSLHREMAALQAKANERDGMAKELAETRAQLAAASGPGREPAAAPAAPAEGEAGKTAESGMPPAAATPAQGGADRLLDDAGKVPPAVANAVVLLEGDKSVGTGFLARDGGGVYLYTAAHVLSGNSKLTVTNAEGRKFAKFGVMGVAEDADLVRLKLDEDFGNPLAINPAGREPRIGMEVAALGNGGGHGVVAVERGRVLGVSASQIEIDAAVIQGNSGGPVLAVETGAVVGLVTHLTSQRNDLWSEGTRQGEVRRFACRVDVERKWTEMPVAAFLAGGRTVKDFDELTLVGFAISSMQATPQGLRYNARGFGGSGPLEIIQRNENDPAVKQLIRFNTDLQTGKAKYGTVDRNRRIFSLVDSLRARLVGTKDALKPETLNPYHRKLARESLEARGKCIQAVDRLLAGLK